MGTRRVRVNKIYECPMCGRVASVEFEDQKFDGDGPNAAMLSATRTDVVDYGVCHAAARSANPRRPRRSDLATCPIFSKD